MGRRLAESYGSFGYDAIDGILDPARELTYGPDGDGWVGFDTNHYNDDWSDEDLERYLPPPLVERLHQVWDVLGRDSWPPGRMRSSTGNAFADAVVNHVRVWTMGTLHDAVNRLAERVVETSSPEHAAYRVTHSAAAYWVTDSEEHPADE